MKQKKNNKPKARKLNSIMSFIKTRIKQNKNFLGLVTGPTGSGKSWISLYYASALDPTFSADRVCFRISDFINLLDSGLPSGSVIIMDESGLSMGARDWHSQINRVMSYILQSHRFMNLIVFFTVPNSAMVDIDLRRLIHGVFEVGSIDYKKKTNRYKFFKISISNRTGKIYYQRLEARYGFEMVSLYAHVTPIPSKPLIRAYEQKKALYLQEMRATLLKSINTQPVEPRQTMKPLIVKALNEGLSVKETAKKFGVSTAHVYNIKSIR